jgi:hypothetical protein
MFDHLPERSLKVRKGRAQRRASGIDDDVPLGIEFRSMQAERFPHTPLDAVPDNASTDRPRNRESQSRPSTLILWPRQTKGGEQRTGNALAVVIHFSEVGGAQGPD